MSTISIRFLALVSVLTVFSSPLYAGGIPDAMQSTMPECIRVMPNGSLTLSGKIVATTGNPITNTAVRFRVKACLANIRQCPCPGSDASILTVFTDAQGDFEFAPTMGGCCADPFSATIAADPGDVTLAIYGGIGSADNTGDLKVTLADFTVFQAEFLTTTECSDLMDCNNFVSVADFTVFQSRFLTECAGGGC